MEYAPCANTTSNFPLACADKPSSHRTGWVRIPAVARQQGIEFRLKKGVRARAARREKKQGYWQESEIKETEAISIELHKDQGKKKYPFLTVRNLF